MDRRRRDLITISGLELRTRALESDLWHRDGREQPLVAHLTIPTSVAEEAEYDALARDSLNYGTVTRAIEAAVSGLDPAHPLALEEIAELIVKTVLFGAFAPECILELERPKAHLAAESIGVRIRRFANEYSPSEPKAGLKPSQHILVNTAGTPPDDVLVIKQLRRDIIIGVNDCEREEEQPVLVDIEVGVNMLERHLQVGFRGVARPEWRDWRAAIKAVESHLTSSRPLTIEHITTSTASLLLTPPNAQSTHANTRISPSWDVSTAKVKLAKPCALMFARHPAVQVFRHRSDFWADDGSKIPSPVRAAENIDESLPFSFLGKRQRDWDHENDDASTSATTVESSSGPTGRQHSVTIGVGTNIGDRPANISKALRMLESLGGEKVRVVDTSFVYESEAMYVENQAKFLNAVFRIETELEPVPLLTLLKKVEDSMGRVKTIRNGPRIIDLDILLFDHRVVRVDKSSPEYAGHWLEIPHKSIFEREFVLKPLSDIAGGLRHPTTASTFSELLHLSLMWKPSTLVKVLPLSPSLVHTLPSRTLVMSILNITPDSFSDGGEHFSPSSAVAAAKAHIAAGADILDVGGMSTRPGASDVDVMEEKRRVVSVIEAIRREGITTPISVDTFRPDVARAAVAAGATMVNDVLGGSEPGMLQAMAELDVPVILMHSRGTPKTMSRLTDYERDDVVAGVRKELEQRVRAALDAGVKRWNIVIDPGIGFAKTGEQNVALLADLPAALGRSTPSHPLGEDDTFLSNFPTLVGLSRKNFLGTLTGRAEPKERVWATAAGVATSVAAGCDVVRVHDVEMAVDVVKVSDAIHRRRRQVRCREFEL